MVRSKIVTFLDLGYGTTAMVSCTPSTVVETLAFHADTSSQLEIAPAMVNDVARVGTRAEAGFTTRQFLTEDSS